MNGDRDETPRPRLRTRLGFCLRCLNRRERGSDLCLRHRTFEHLHAALHGRP